MGQGQKKTSEREIMYFFREFFWCLVWKVQNVPWNNKVMTAQHFKNFCNFRHDEASRIDHVYCHVISLSTRTDWITTLSDKINKSVTISFFSKMKLGVIN